MSPTSSSKKPKLIHGDVNRERPDEDEEIDEEAEEFHDHDQHLSYDCEGGHRLHPHGPFDQTSEENRSPNFAKKLSTKVLYIEPHEAICQGCMNVGSRGYICSICDNKNFYDTVHDPNVPGGASRDMMAVRDNLYHFCGEIYKTYFQNVVKKHPAAEQRNQETFVEEPDSIFRRLPNATVPNYNYSQWEKQMLAGMQYSSYYRYPVQQRQERRQHISTPKLAVEPTTTYQTNPPTDQDTKSIFPQGVPFRSARKRKYPRESKKQVKKGGGDSTGNSPASTTDSSWSP